MAEFSSTIAVSHTECVHNIVVYFDGRRDETSKSARWDRKRKDGCRLGTDLARDCDVLITRMRRRSYDIVYPVSITLLDII